MSQPHSTTTSPYTEHAAHSDHGQGPPRKKMRKGTKSCIECRRRKIKCTFEPGRTAVCNECYARGSTCVDQEHSDTQPSVQMSEPSSYSLRERVTQLEDLVKEVLNRIPDNNYNHKTIADVDRRQVDTQAAKVLESLKQNGSATASVPEQDTIFVPSVLRGDAPVLSLFDNAVLTRKDSIPVVSRAQYNKSKLITIALHNLLPSPHDLDIILESSHEWWTIWRKMFPEISDRRCETMKESVSHSLRSENPAEVAKMMLCIAISIHQMPDSIEWEKLHLRETRSELMEKYTNAIGKFITSDDEIASTVDGIECVIFEAKYQMNMGRPKKAWHLFRRAISFAQLLGFHRLASFPDKSSADFKRQFSIWTHLVVGDRYLSLMLGLPYNIPAVFGNIEIPGLDPTVFEASAGEEYLCRLLPVVTKLVERNQSTTPLSYSATMTLDNDLEEAYRSKDSAWWTPEMIPGQSIENHFDRIQAQFCHHQIKVLLHQPFMLKSSGGDKRYQYSHESALDGARNMIRCYDALRDNPKVGPYICKMVDFQAFTGAMLLLLNLCGYSAQHRHGKVQPPDLASDQNDSDLIDRTIHLLHEASQEVGGLVAAQSAQALEILAKARQGMDDKCVQKCANETRQVVIPYFGTVTIGPGKHFVPIKPGTYVPGNGKVINTVIAAGGAANTGLPTPPSMTSGSTQQSPMSQSLDNTYQQQPPLARRPPVYESTDYIAPGLSGDWGADDPLITFDSFMAMPPQGFDFPTAGGSSSTSGFTPQALSNTPGRNDQYNTGMNGGFPFGNYFGAGMQGIGNVDLDQGWNWFGVDAPTMQ